ncbi:MAG: GTP-binding protein [Candidatus Thorarchaeota archaeon]|nr:GTP-binding protein [Candidatus Thorarchaeota archaeon]
MTTKTVKVALVDCGAAGKTSIVTRLSTGIFIERLMTVGFNVETWSVKEDGGDALVKAALFDFGGQEQFRFFQAGLMRGAIAVLLCVDVTRFMSLLELDDWLPLIEDIPKKQWILVANKIDEGGLVTEDVINEKAEEIGIPYLMVNAKTGENFDVLTDKLSEIVLSQAIDQFL